MYDAGKIISGLIIFVCLVTLPIWYALASRSAALGLELEITTEEERCVEPRQYMIENMDSFLLKWRETVVREGNRTYISSYGEEYDMSLAGTCLDCHSNKAEFCDRCHNYVGVEPDCWNCHNPPEGD